MGVAPPLRPRPQRPAPDRPRPWVVLLHVACLVPLAAVLALAVVTTGAMVVGWSPKIVVSGSMAPWLQPGDVVLAAPARPGMLEDGQIVVFESDRAPGGEITHRLVTQRADGRWVTRGDANPVVDPRPVAPERITGVVEVIVPRVGLPSLWVRTGEVVPLGLWAVVMAASVWGAVRTHAEAARAFGLGGRGARATGRGAAGSRGREGAPTLGVRLPRLPPPVLLATALGVGGLVAFLIWWVSLAVRTGSMIWVVFVGGGLLLLLPAAAVLAAQLGAARRRSGSGPADPPGRVP